MAKILASVNLPNVCLFTGMALRWACLFWHPTCPMTLIVYKHISQLVKYKRVVGTQQVSDLTSKHTLVSPFFFGLHLQIICAKQSSGHDKYKCSVPTTYQISASDIFAAYTSCRIADFDAYYTLCSLLSDTFIMYPSFLAFPLSFVTSVCDGEKFDWRLADMKRCGQ